jgi:hypothetical protein
LADFQKYKKALTPAGLVKTGDRNEKDDRPQMMQRNNLEQERIPYGYAATYIRERLKCGRSRAGPYPDQGKKVSP